MLYSLHTWGGGGGGGGGVKEEDRIWKWGKCEGKNL